MAIKATINFSISLVPDGTSLSVTLALATIPFIVYLGPGFVFNPAFTPGSATLSGVANVQSWSSTLDGMIATTITGSLASGNLTLTWPIAPQGPVVVVTGNFLF